MWTEGGTWCERELSAANESVGEVFLAENVLAEHREPGETERTIEQRHQQVLKTEIKDWLPKRTTKQLEKSVFKGESEEQSDTRIL